MPSWKYTATGLALAFGALILAVTVVAPVTVGTAHLAPWQIDRLVGTQTTAAPSATSDVRATAAATATQAPGQDADYAAGRAAGYATGRAAGYDAGYATGRGAGYDAGYAAGQAAAYSTAPAGPGQQVANPQPGAVPTGAAANPGGPTAGQPPGSVGTCTGLGLALSPGVGNPAAIDSCGIGTAAVAFDWGAPNFDLSDEFNYAGPPNPDLWSSYDSSGNGGNGLRRPSQNTVQNGYLQISGLPDGTSGGMLSRPIQPGFGRWEARMRVDKQGGGGAYHPVIALVPNGVPYDGGAGDLDFAETDAGSGQVYIFIHYPPRKQDYLAINLDLAQWHDYAIEVAPDHITWFIDGKAVMTDKNQAAITGTNWNMNIQLDANQPDGQAPSNLQVDYFRHYPLPPVRIPIIPAPAPQTSDYG